jgi:hypothetical protein
MVIKWCSVGELSQAHCSFAISIVVSLELTLVYSDDGNSMAILGRSYYRLRLELTTACLGVSNGMGKKSPCHIENKQIWEVGRRAKHSK